MSDIERELKDARDELEVYRLASETAVYEASQFDRGLFLSGDRGVEDVMRRVLGELAAARNKSESMAAEIQRDWSPLVAKLTVKRDLWQKRANALLEIAKAAADIVGAAYAIQDSGNYVVSGVEFERLQSAVESCKRMSEQGAK